MRADVRFIFGVIDWSRVISPMNRVDVIIFCDIDTCRFPLMAVAAIDQPKQNNHFGQTLNSAPANFCGFRGENLANRPFREILESPLILPCKL